MDFVICAMDCVPLLLLSSDQFVTVCNLLMKTYHASICILGCTGFGYFLQICYQAWSVSIHHHLFCGARSGLDGCRFRKQKTVHTGTKPEDMPLVGLAPEATSMEAVKVGCRWCCFLKIDWLKDATTFLMRMDVFFFTFVIRAWLMIHDSYRFVNLWTPIPFPDNHEN